MLLPVSNHKLNEIPMWLHLERGSRSRYDVTLPTGISARGLNREEFDADAHLVERHHQLFLEGFTRGGPDELAWQDTMSSMSLIVLLEREGVLVGAGQANIVGPIALVHNIVVAKSVRGQKLGWTVSNRVLFEAYQYARWAALHCDPEHNERQLYERLEFFNIDEAFEALQRLRSRAA